MNFKIKSDEKKNIGVVSIEGEVDMLTSPRLMDELTPFFKRKVKGVIVNLSCVTFMDSSGIATLVEGLQWSKKENKPFILTGLRENVLNSLRLTKLDKVFTIKKDTEDAYRELCELS